MQCGSESGWRPRRQLVQDLADSGESDSDFNFKSDFVLLSLSASLSAWGWL